MAGADILSLENEVIEADKEYRYFHTMVDYRQFLFTASKVEALLKKRLENGRRTQPREKDSVQIRKSRKVMETQLDTFDESYKRILNPHIYKVSLSENLKDLKKMFIEANIR